MSSNSPQQADQPTPERIELLVERLRERALSYRQSGPSAFHTALLLEEAASALASPPTAPEGDWVRLMEALAVRLDAMAQDRQDWADHPEIGGKKPPLNAHLRGKRYGYSHAAQLIRSALASAPPPPQAQDWREQAAREADIVVLRVCEYDDRTSPEDWPEALLITSEELHSELMQFADRLRARLGPPPQAGLVEALTLARERIAAWEGEQFDREDDPLRQTIDQALALHRTASQGSAE